jgi:hypothetical protein
MPDPGRSFAGYVLLIESIARDVIRDPTETDLASAPATD